MNQNTTHRIITALAVLVIIIFGVFFFFRRTGEEGGMATTTLQTASTSSVFLPGQHTESGVTGTGDFKVEAIPTLKTPSFTAPLVFSIEVSPEVRAIIQKKFADIQTALEKDSTDLKAWLELGAMRKTAGDYKGAEIAWRFVADANSKNTTAFWNLGDLYTNFLKDYLKAESAYKSVIAVEPRRVEAYRELANLYTNLYKKSASATEDILKKGVVANPDSVDLHILLARYYKSAGKAADAKVHYDHAIALAAKQGNTTLSAQIQAEARE